MAREDDHYKASRYLSGVACRPPLVFLLSRNELRKVKVLQAVTVIIAVLQLGMAISVMAVTRRYLVLPAVPHSLGTWRFWSDDCYLGTPDNQWLCTYSYVLGGISICVTMVLAIMQCAPEWECCGGRRALEAACDGIGLMWWLAGAIILTMCGVAANYGGIPKGAPRAAVIALAWASVLVFLVLIMINVVLIKQLGKAHRDALQHISIEGAAPQPPNPDVKPPATAVAAQPFGAAPADAAAAAAADDHASGGASKVHSLAGPAGLPAVGKLSSVAV